MGSGGSIEHIAVELCVFGELVVKYCPPTPRSLQVVGEGSISCEAEGETEQRKMPSLISGDSTQSRGGCVTLRERIGWGGAAS